MFMPLEQSMLLTLKDIFWKNIVKERITEFKSYIIAKIDWLFIYLFNLDPFVRLYDYSPGV